MRVKISCTLSRVSVIYFSSSLLWEGSRGKIVSRGVPLGYIFSKHRLWEGTQWMGWATLPQCWESTNNLSQTLLVSAQQYSKAATSHPFGVLVHAGQVQHALLRCLLTQVMMAESTFGGLLRCLSHWGSDQGLRWRRRRRGTKSMNW